MNRSPGFTTRFVFGALVLAAVLGSVVLGRAALAHEYWLAPSRYTATLGAEVTIGAIAGTGFRGDWKPWSPTHGVRFVVRASKTLDLASVADPGETTWARFAPSDAGGAIVAFVSDFTPITLDATTFDRYLADEGLRVAAAARVALRSHGAVAPPGRERYRRCAKTWLAGADGAGVDAARATTPLGLPLEIVPTSVPGVAPSITIHVLRNGRPLSGALVKAWHESLGPGGVSFDGAERDSVGVSFRGVTDAQGEIQVAVVDHGEWLLSAVDMVPSADPAAADWESTWASLTFAR